MRERYRAKFKLTSSEMDNEPLDEVFMMQEIWKLDHKREKLDNEKAKQRGKAKGSY